jgi:hypothetical protein
MAEPKRQDQRGEGSKPPPALGLLPPELGIPEVGTKTVVRRGFRGLLAKWFLPYR